MEDVVEKFEATNISQGTNDIKSNYGDLYKNWGKLGNQEERRKEILEFQKSNRNSKLDSYRGILNIVKAVEENGIFYTNKPAHYKPNIHVAGFHKVVTYNNVLMNSEWLIEKPQDFIDNWYMVPCPIGVRQLVVANRGITKFYTKYGHIKFECRTALPGGNPCDGTAKKNVCCVLDCFYHEKNNTLYILDLLAWNNQTMTDCETEFRNYWLKSQLLENPALQKISNKNKVIFSLLPMVPCTPESLNEFMMKYPPFEDDVPPLDGLLFYHKRAHYVAGETPLVGWLFPYMVPDILGADIQVNEKYMAGKPLNYIDQATFITQFEEKYNKKKNKCRHSSISMDTSETKNETLSKKKSQKSKTKIKKELMDVEDNSVKVPVNLTHTDERNSIDKSSENNNTKKSLGVEIMEAEDNSMKVTVNMTDTTGNNSIDNSPEKNNAKKTVQVEIMQAEDNTMKTTINFTDTNKKDSIDQSLEE